MAEVALSNGLRRMSMSREAKARYSPPWASMSIIGIAGASGSGKTSLAVEVVKTLDLPWVIIMSIVRDETSWLTSADIPGLVLQISYSGAECLGSC